jgi:hypothetical protein
VKRVETLRDEAIRLRRFANTRPEHDINEYLLNLADATDGDADALEALIASNREHIRRRSG